MRQILIVILTIGVISCKQETTKNISINKNIDYYDQLEILYHQCDTVIETTDTIKVVNSKLDTTIAETGVFTYLQYDYPLTTPQELINLSKAAIKYSKQGQKEKATALFKNIVDFYLKERPKQLKGFSDMNCYLQYEVNSAILCSYAYESLGDKENAIKTLQPFLANVEAWNSKIHVRYIQLCVDKYGIDKVKEELKNCGKSIKLKKQDSPEIDDWVISVFGAEVGVGKTCETNQISATQADNIVRQLDFYKLIQ